MTRAQGEPTGPVDAGPDDVRLPEAAAPDRLVVGPLLLLEALAALAAADRREDVAAAALPLLLEEPGVRACAVVVRDGVQAVVLASAGYGCGSMAPGAVLPLDAGLPVTEAVRTGRPVHRGTGPAWVAVPFGGPRRDGALLLSLTVPPPSGADDLARLDRLVRALGDALRRAAAQDRASAELAEVAATLAPVPLRGGDDLALRSVPVAGPLGGDVALRLPDARGGSWVLVADVCGSGLAAAATARAVAAAVSAAAPHVDGPAALLRAVERAVLPDVGPGSFVTAVACRLLPGRAVLASAGHPPPLLVTGTCLQALDVLPSPPLALETGWDDAVLETDLALAPDAVLLLHTDGLTDRRGPHGTRTLDPATLLAPPWPHDLEALADAVVDAATAVGPAADDVTVLVVRAG